MIRFIFRTDHTDHGITFWRESRQPSEVHDVTGGHAYLALRQWGWRDRNKPVKVTAPKHTVGFSAPEEEP